MTDSPRWAAPSQQLPSDLPSLAAKRGFAGGIAGATDTGPGVDADAAALSSLLWRERELLEDLLFRLAEQQHLLAAGDVRWLPRADEDLRAAAEAVREHEILRAAEVDLLARRLQISPDTALQQLAEVAPEPWPDLLLDHREALRTLTLEIEAMNAQSQRLAQAGERATRTALEASLRPGATPGVSALGRDSAFGGDFGGDAYILDRHA